MKLIEVLRAYPGGCKQLARDSRVGLYTLYRVGHLQHARKPVETFDRLARAFSGKEVCGRRFDYDALARMWDDEVTERGR